MGISYDGIGEWCATFGCGKVKEGDVVKVSANGSADVCGAGDCVCGGVRVFAREGMACSVQLGGIATGNYSGENALIPGYCKLIADAAGGVSVDASKGREYLILAADSAAKTVTIKL